MPIEVKSFGVLSSGEEARLFILSNGEYRSTWTDYGATWVSMFCPDARGRSDDVILGFPTLDGYARGPNPFMGATVGRFANRIGGSCFSLGGKIYPLFANNGTNHLHGGRRGFDKHTWRAETSFDSGDPLLVFTRRSPDGEEGYPGNLDVKVEVRLSSAGVVSIDYFALSDAPTPANITNHAYFNLGGEGSGPILGHRLSLACSSYIEVDAGQIPIPGSPRPVAGGCFDFRQPKPIGRDIGETLNGYDHCFVIDPLPVGQAFAEVLDPGSGRLMRIRTTSPSVQFYTGNNLLALQGKRCSKYEKHAGFCLETEFYPDTPNRPDFPSCIVQPGETWHYRTEYEFALAGAPDA